MGKDHKNRDRPDRNTQRREEPVVPRWRGMGGQPNAEHIVSGSYDCLCRTDSATQFSEVKPK